MDDFELNVISLNKKINGIDKELNATRGEQELSIDRNWMSAFMPSKELMDKIADPDWVYKDLIIQGHVVLLVAEPNGGKSAICRYLASSIVDSGKTVLYVNMDTSGSDAKFLYQHSLDHGYDLLLPDIANRTVSELLKNLEIMSKEDEPLNSQVWFFDTLKKLADVISKKDAKKILNLFRALSSKGCTVVLLAHTNKYPDAEGNPIYEGTADLRSDCDELIYLIPEEQKDGTLLVSTKPDKVRGTFENITFEASDGGRKVCQLEKFVDVQSSVSKKIARGEHQAEIEAISEAISLGKNKHVQIIEFCKDRGFGRRAVEKVIRLFKVGNSHDNDEIWRREKGFDNAIVHYLVNGHGKLPY